MIFTSEVPFLKVQTRSGSSSLTTPALSFMPMAVDASSAVRRLHGSIETVPGEPAPPALGLSGTTATGLGAVEPAEGEATEPEQAASARAAIGMSDRERFVRMRIG